MNGHRESSLDAPSATSGAGLAADGRSWLARALLTSLSGAVGRWFD